jgi:DNA-binding transcriptional MerR regulator
VGATRSQVTKPVALGPDKLTGIFLIDTRTSECKLSSMNQPTTFTLSELCEAADVSERTVRYYVTQGLLPSPGSGRGVRWSQGHFERLQLILQLKEKHLPLAEIRRRLEGMAASEVSALLATQQAQQPAASASDYVQQVLAGLRPAPAKKKARSSDTAKPSAAPGEQAITRTSWERIHLDPDVELHVRRPLSRVQDKRVQRLISVARDIFDKEES